MHKKKLGEMNDKDMTWIKSEWYWIRGTGIGNSIEGFFMPVLPPKDRSH